MLELGEENWTMGFVSGGAEPLVERIMLSTSDNQARSQVQIGPIWFKTATIDAASPPT